MIVRQGCPVRCMLVDGPHGSANCSQDSKIFSFSRGFLAGISSLSNWYQLIKLQNYRIPNLSFMSVKRAPFHASVYKIYIK